MNEESREIESDVCLLRVRMREKVYIVPESFSIFNLLFFLQPVLPARCCSVAVQVPECSESSGESVIQVRGSLDRRKFVQSSLGGSPAIVLAC